MSLEEEPTCELHPLVLLAMLGTLLLLFVKRGCGAGKLEVALLVLGGWEGAAEVALLVLGGWEGAAEVALLVLGGWEGADEVALLVMLPCGCGAATDSAASQNARPHSRLGRGRHAASASAVAVAAWDTCEEAWVPPALRGAACATMVLWASKGACDNTCDNACGNACAVEGLPVAPSRDWRRTAGASKGVVWGEEGRGGCAFEGWGKWGVSN